MLIQFTLLITLVANLFLLAILLKRKNSVSYAFSVVIFGISVWTFAVLVWPLSNNQLVLYALGLVAYWGALVSAVGLFYFSYVFPIRNALSKIFFLFGSFIAFVCGVAMTLIPNFVLKGAVGHGYQLETGNGIYPFFALLGVLLVAALLNLVNKYFHLSGLYRLQLRFFFSGALLTSVVGFASNALLVLVGVYDFIWLGPVITLIFIGFVTYSITQYRLLDIRSVLARTVTFGFIVAFLVAVYAAASTLIALLFESIARVQSNIIVSVITSLFVVLGYTPLKKFIEKVTEKFLFQKTYDPDKLLASVTEVTSSILDLSQLLKSLSKVMGDAFHYEKFGITLLDEKNKMEIFYKEGFKPAVAEGLVSYKGVTEALYKELEQVSGLLVIDEMKTRFENGEFKPADPVLLNLLHENDIAVIVPLYVKDRLIGIFAVGNKKSGDSYSTQDLGILRIIAGQAGIAIENARLYEELKTFNIKLEQEVRRKTMQLRRANTDLKQLDKAKSEFISIASHQLRTPLTIIKGYISMMQEGSFGAVPVPIAENLKKVFISNERLIQLVEDLLDISRIESGRQEFNWAKIRLENLAQTVVDNLMQNAGAKNLKLAFHKPAKPTPEVVADENKLHEVMMNFVDNAIKYTPSGQIDVFVRVDKGDVVTFCVKDTGKGITSELQDVLFKKFSRGKDSFRSHTEGLGLGLYVAKLMMEAHKGKIWAESDGENKGASFCFSIPVKGVELKAGATSQANLIKPSASQPAAVASSSK